MSQVPVLVIGSGITGLYIALELADAGRSVRLVSKGPLSECNTRYAQGGMAVAIAAGDSPALHLADTLVAGAGLCDEAAVEVLTREGPARFQDLLARGVAFDREGGEVALTLEAAHGRRRVVHAGGDATGAEIERALVAQVRAHPLITVWEHAFVWDLVIEAGRCVGALVLHGGRAWRVPGAAVVLAAGGLGRLFAHTTNPPVATGDGVAIALRACAATADLEFVQFHPTALTLADGGTFLISEAVRGEGAILRNKAGEAFMVAVDPRAELAPRDIVARAIAHQMTADGRRFVHLDLAHLDAGLVAKRFPTIQAVCAGQGIQLPADPIPVAPAAHYSCGGVATDLDAQSSIPGLFAAGEVARTGVHGANRLASNSLLECVVFGHRAARAILALAPRDAAAEPQDLLAMGTGSLPRMAANFRGTLRQLMWHRVGLLRDAAGLTEAVEKIGIWREEVAPLTDWSFRAPDLAVGELRNMLDTGLAMARAALARRESRGCHFRLDGD